jgi:hypothetical protein
MQRHERLVRERLDQGGGEELAAVRARHARRLRFMQHERLIHLIVTMFVALFALLAVGFGVTHPSWASGALAALLLGLTGAYLVHYFRLENGVQRWYELDDRLEEALRRPPDVAPVQHPRAT